MDLVDIISWTILVLLIVPLTLGIRAVLYFGRHRQALNSWLYEIIYRVVFTITAVALGLTASRAAVMVFGPQGWLTPVVLALLLWLLFIPYLIHRKFTEHEDGDRPE